MPRTPFEIAFDHIMDECTSEPRCDLLARRLCPEGRALMNAAHDLCVRLAAYLDTPEVKA